MCQASQGRAPLSHLFVFWQKNLILKLLKDGLNLCKLIPEFCWKVGVWEAFMQILQIKIYLAVLFTLWGVWAAHLPNIVRPHLQASVSVLLLIPRSPSGLLELGKEQLIVPKPHSQHACCFPVFFWIMGRLGLQNVTMVHPLSLWTSSPHQLAGS